MKGKVVLFRTNHPERFIAVTLDPESIWVVNARISPKKFVHSNPCPAELVKTAKELAAIVRLRIVDTQTVAILRERTLYR